MNKRYQVMLPDWLVDYLDKDPAPRSRVIRYILYKGVLGRQRYHKGQYEGAEREARRIIEGGISR